MEAAFEMTRPRYAIQPGPGDWSASKENSNRLLLGKVPDQKQKTQVVQGTHLMNPPEQALRPSIDQAQEVDCCFCYKHCKFETQTMGIKNRLTKDSHQSA